LIWIDVQQHARFLRRMNRREDFLADTEVGYVEVGGFHSLGHREGELPDLSGRDH
jgi:hypothetical protein